MAEVGAAAISTFYVPGDDLEKCSTFDCYKIETGFSVLFLLLFES